MSDSSVSHRFDCMCSTCEEEVMLGMQLNLVLAGGVQYLAAYKHYMTYCLKRPMRDSALTGPQWVWEIWNGNDRRFFGCMRMRKPVLQHLLSTLVASCGLDPQPKWVTLEESLAIFLLICGEGATYSSVEERVQRSSETISNHFHMVLDAVCKLGRHLIRPIDPEFKEDPEELVRNPKAWPAFKGCIGAIDGTHIPLHIPDREKRPWVNRKGVVTTNVLAVCDFKMCVTFAQVGMEGSMHDSRVLSESMKIPERKFPLPPNGKYYLADAGYPLMNGFMTPYRKTRYHLPEFHANRVFANANEIFNYRHSSLRSVIERTFGVLKKRWRVLTNMSMVSLKTQLKIIWACITIHNFVRRYDADDLPLLTDVVPDEDIELSSILHRAERDEWFASIRTQPRDMEARRDHVRSIVAE